MNAITTTAKITYRLSKQVVALTMVMLAIMYFIIEPEALNGYMDQVNRHSSVADLKWRFQKEADKKGVYDEFKTVPPFELLVCS